MSTLEAFILGLIQGLTEFLPISSSGHLALGQRLLGLSDLGQYLLFDLICHAGTLFAILFAFRKEIMGLLSDRQKLGGLFLGTLPLFPLVFVMKPIKAIYSDPQYLGICFLFTAAVLYFGFRARKEITFQSETVRKLPRIDDRKLVNIRNMNRLTIVDPRGFGAVSDVEVISLRALRAQSTKVMTPGSQAHDSSCHMRRWYDPLLIGLSQAVAVLPGISRSGTTIAAAYFLGWPPKEAITFSFLLAIPAILGGTILQVGELILKGEGQLKISVTAYIAAFATSFAIGLLSMRLLIFLASKDKLGYFVWYCTLLGLLLLFW